MPHFSYWRRDFLQKSMASAAVLLGAACSRAQRPEHESFELDEATVAKLRQRMESGQDSAASIVKKYLARIESIDRAGPRINSLIEINPDAITIAQGLDAERSAGRVRGPLHGIPIVIKDNIDTADRMMTTAGSLATSGWSGRGGLTLNPYALDRSTSGSSSGTAAAISCNLAAIGIGTDTNGSIVSPSSCCGLVGIRPTVGLVSREGIIPISKSMDTAGPMARTVTRIEVGFMDNTGIPGEENVVGITHNDGSQALYFHLAQNGSLVAMQQVVAQGESIALSGNSGNSTEPHLHFVVGGPPGTGGVGTVPISFRNTAPHSNGLVQGQTYTAQ